MDVYWNVFTYFLICATVLHNMAIPIANAATNPVYVQLVGGSTANQGRVGVIYSNTTGRVCNDNWTDNDAKVVCSMLGYQRLGSRTSPARAFPSGLGGVWLADVNCLGHEMTISQCPTFNGWASRRCPSSHDAGVICSTGSSLDNFLIVTDSQHRHIYRMDLSTFSYAEIPHDSHSIPIAVGYDHIERDLYWSDVQTKYIKKSNLDGSNSRIVLHLPSTAVPDGLAVDPISRNLYITDTGSDRITVSRLDGSAYTHIITSGLDEPRGIAVHPGIGYMFWTDWSSTNPRIEKSKMDGSARSTIATSNLRWPNDIAIDYSANLLYWVDGSTNTIEKADFNGRNRTTIFTEPGQIFGLALIQDFIYYTDWRERNILRILKAGRDRTIVGPAVFGRLNGLLTYKSGEGIETLNATNGCTTDSGNCSHICVPMPNNAIACLCPGNMTLDVDGKTCRPDQNIRLVGGNNTYEGRVEVYHSSRWGTVCDDSWSVSDARVVCRMLGYSGGTAVCCSIFGPGSGIIWLDNVGCTGTEADIAACRHNAWGSNDCTHSEDAGVRCDDGGVTNTTIRLVGGNNTYEGRVEVYHSGRWGTVCDDSWDIADARVVCRMLGYSGGTAVCCSGFGPGSGTIWLDNVGCTGTEADIADCRHNTWGSNDCTHSEDAGVRCDGSVVTSNPLSTTTTTSPTSEPSDVRLVGGNSTHEGRVEIYHSGSWGTICDDDWNNSSASVICRMLGYSDGTAVCCAQFGSGSGTIWLDNVRCTGNESDIADCDHNRWGSNNCVHNEDAGVQCTANSTLSSTTTTNIVARTSPSSTIRLIGGNSSYEGLVEVYHSGTWGTICDDGWNNAGASVVCRMLGYGGGTAVCCARLGSGSGTIWLDDVRCYGNETDIADCNYLGWGRHNCGHSEDAGVRCDVDSANSTSSSTTTTNIVASTSPSSTIRLIGGNSSYEGLVEVYHSGTWGTICDDGWNNADASVVCRMLGYGGGTAVCCARLGSGSGTIWLDDVRCYGNETDIADCNYLGWGRHNCGHSEDAGVRCDVDSANSTSSSTTTTNIVASTSPSSTIRLIGGNSSYEGRVEVHHSGTWGTICDDGWNNADASVVCRMLGYGGGTAVCCARLGSGSGTIWLDDVRCYGNETDIADCIHPGWGRHNCGHSEDAGVRCDVDSANNTSSSTTTTNIVASTSPSSTIRLIGGNSSYEGRVEVHHSGTWGTICDDGWNNADASVVCRMLGYGGGTAVCCARLGSGSGTIWLDDVRCYGNETDIGDCNHPVWGSHDCGHSEDAGVRCDVSMSTSPPTTLQPTFWTPNIWTVSSVASHVPIICHVVTLLITFVVLSTVLI